MSDLSNTLTSIGVDVGTTTTHAIVSRLRVETPPSGTGSPRITDREICHRGTVRETPLLDPETIDIDAVVAIVTAELDAAGVTAAEIDTGAVIVTGETARRENAEPLAHRLADDSGQFVAATAGSALEAVLAGRGSGGAAHAARTGGVVVTVDVGGGTTNVAVFDASGSRSEPTVRDTRCIDVGGRLLSVDDAGCVSSLSPPAQTLIDTLDLPIAVGETPSEGALETLADTMADRIVDCCMGPPFDALTQKLAIGELPSAPIAVDGVVFSGGVGRLVVDPPEDPLAYGDLGGYLAAAIAAHEQVQSWPVIDPTEDIRATVVGAGTETTTLSGRTIAIDRSVVPLRNVPVVAVSGVDECGPADIDRRFTTAIDRLQELYEPDEIDAAALSIDSIGPLTYERLQVVAAALARSIDALPDSLPIVVVTRQNCAKALGQSLRRRTDRPLVVIDELTIGEGDYLDVGDSLIGSESVPVVVKTLAFGE